MFKFFRKHGKWLLAIFGVLLMIVFLVPQAIEGLGQQAASKRAIAATIGDGEEIKLRDFEPYQSDLEIFERRQAPVGEFGILSDPWHWYLLVREADQAGLIGGLASDYLPPEQLAQLLVDVRHSPQVINEAFGRYLGVGRMLNAYVAASELSDVRLRHEAARLFHEVDAEIVTIQAAAQDDTPMPTEDAIQAQYDTYRETIPGEGEHGFGYLLPDRFKLEWISIPDASLRAMIGGEGEIDAVALMKHWQRYENDPLKAFPTVDRGAEIPEAVRTDYINTQADEKRTEIRRNINSRLDNTRRQLRRAKGYYDLPETWGNDRLALPDLARQLQDKFAGLALPVYEAVGDRWLTMEDLVEFEVLTGVSTRLLDPARPQRLPDLVGTTREFKSETQTVYLIQEGVAGPILANPTNDLIVFRITDTDPSRAPITVDEVRDEIVADLQRKAHYEALVAQLDELEHTARQNGLLTFAILNGHETTTETGLSLYNRQAVQWQQQIGMGLTPIPSVLPVIGQDVDVLGEIIDRAMTFPTDQALGGLPAAVRTFAFAADDSMTVLIVQMTRQAPLDQDLYEFLIGAGLPGMLMYDELNQTDFPRSVAFSRETLGARHNLEIRTRRDQEAEEDDAAGDDEAGESADAEAEAASE